jgi:hypothetical protein
MGEAVNERPQRLTIAARAARQADQRRFVLQSIGHDLQLRVHYIEEETHAVDG